MGEALLGSGFTIEKLEKASGPLRPSQRSVQSARGRSVLRPGERTERHTRKAWERARAGLPAHIVPPHLPLLSSPVSGFI